MTIQVTMGDTCVICYNNLQSTRVKNINYCNMCFSVNEKAMCVANVDRHEICSFTLGQECLLVKRQHTTLQKMENDGVDDRIRLLLGQNGQFKVIILYNIFQWIESPKDIISLCMRNCSIIFISTPKYNNNATHQRDTNGKWYYSINAMKLLCEMCNVFLCTVRQNNEHVVYEIHKFQKPNSNSNVIESLYSDIENGVYDEQFYR